MKIATHILKLGVLVLLLTTFQCNNDDSISLTCEERVTQLDKMKVAIETLANTSVCNENFECRYMAYGSKPCGGPWGYLVYSTSIDTLKLAQLVEEYDKFEDVLNKECERFSDCAMVNPPQRLECENNKCIAIY